MRFKIFGVLAAVALLGACSSTDEDAGATSGTGAASAKPAETYTTPLGMRSAGAEMAKNVPGSQDDLDEQVGARAYFGYDQHSLNSTARGVLDKQAAWMQANPAVNVTIEGHCDERGTTDYNLALGARRANAVKDYLVALGVNPSRVKTISYGKEKPRAIASTEAAWAQNRRSETVVNGAGS
jgi:peptidoglycan-associated lipoprotein